MCDLIPFFISIQHYLYGTVSKTCCPTIKPQCNENVLSLIGTVLAWLTSAGRCGLSMTISSSRSYLLLRNRSWAREHLITPSCCSSYLHSTKRCTNPQHYPHQIMPVSTTLKLVRLSTSKQKCNYISKKKIITYGHRKSSGHHVQAARNVFWET